jgi:hypothetical protein
MNSDPRRTGLAMASLALGILSFLPCPGPLAGIPAIFLGHRARLLARENPDQYAGAGIALAGLICGYVSTIAAIFFLWLAMSAAKAQAQEINCINNLKQVGTALRLWAGDNRGQYPFNVSTNAGGTFEFCARGPDGFDTNAWRHFQVLSNELGTTKILQCPPDRSKSWAVDFVTFGAGNVSYQLRSGTNIAETHPEAVLVRCPVHGTEVLCDGSIKERSQQR